MTSVSGGGGPAVQRDRYSRGGGEDRAAPPLHQRSVIRYRASAVRDPIQSDSPVIVTAAYGQRMVPVTEDHAALGFEIYPSIFFRADRYLA